jgi:hypothetical protein
MANLAELTARKALYLAAEAKVLAGQEYAISDGAINRRMRHADLEQIRAAITEIDSQIAALGGGAAGPRRVYVIRNCG